MERERTPAERIFLMLQAYHQGRQWMRVTSVYRVEILKLHKPLKKTLKVCREASDWLYPVMNLEWDELSRVDGGNSVSMQRRN